MYTVFTITKFTTYDVNYTHVRVHVNILFMSINDKLLVNNDVIIKGGNGLMKLGWDGYTAFCMIIYCPPH